jgi:ankyrin repeat domain-containing protein 27
MECLYDEDLNQNVFFQLLQSEHQDLFQKATLEGWVICIPRIGALPKYPLTDEDFLSHILIPSDELPESHFCSLTDRQVKVLDRVITAEAEDGRTYSTNILFEETCYTDELYKYKVLCLESILEAHSCAGHSVSQTLISLSSLRDCIDFLWAESSGQPVLEKLDESVQAFLSSQPELEEESLQVQEDLARGLYEHCLRSTLRDERLQAQIKNNRHLKQNVRIAVETYVQHGIYKSLIKGNYIFSWIIFPFLLTNFNKITSHEYLINRYSISNMTILRKSASLLIFPNLEHTQAKYIINLNV